MNDFIAKLGEAINAVKCCLPTPLQTLLNVVTSVIDLLFCPINGLIDGLSNTVRLPEIVILSYLLCVHSSGAWSNKLS